MEYRWLSPSAANRTANVTISHKGVYQAPELQETFLTPWRSGAGIRVQLESVSRRLATTGGDSIGHNRYRIHRAPAFGDLYQVNMPAISNQRQVGAEKPSQRSTPRFLLHVQTRVYPNRVNQNYGLLFFSVMFCSGQARKYQKRMGSGTVLPELCQNCARRYPEVNQKHEPEAQTRRHPEVSQDPFGSD